MIPNWTIFKKEKDSKKFFLRAKIISLIRAFFGKENFLEVETPSLVKLPGMEPYIDPIKVDLPILGGKRETYLITSPEYAMKKILAAGFPKIFQICKSFRGGEAIDDLHNPEFTILEWYRAHADYNDIMDDMERLINFVGNNLKNKKRVTFPKKAKNLKIKYQGKTIDLTSPWQRMTVKEVFSKYANIELDKALEREQIAREAVKRGYVVSKNDSFDDIFFKIFLNEIEPRLNSGKPVILYDWPYQMAALSQRKKQDPRYAERFEVYIGGLELGNAFSELIDSNEQRKRLIKERNLRKSLGKEIYDIDEDFLEALREMPPSGGIAVGVDRIAMLFTDAKKIDEVMFFPAKQIL